MPKLISQVYISYGYHCPLKQSSVHWRSIDIGLLDNLTGDIEGHCIAENSTGTMAFF